MRVLCSSPPMEGLVGPVLPVAEAARDLGHDVMIVTGPELEQRVGLTGVTFTDDGCRAMDSAIEAFGAAERRTELPEDVRFGAALFGDVIAPARLPALAESIRSWRPDVVVHPSVDLAAPLAAAELGITSVTCSTGMMLERDLLGGLVASVRRLWDGAALDPPADGGLFRYRYLDIWPRSLQADLGPAEQVARPLRPNLPGDPRAALPAWADRLGERAVVYVTLGTVPLFNQPSSFEPILAALADAGVDAIVTVGENNDPASIGAAPHTFVERWLSLASVLPRCDAVICHGGSGTTLAALAAGLPLLLVPAGADQFANARACEAGGVSRTVYAPDGASAADAIAEALPWLLSDPARNAAGRVAAEISAMPSAGQVVHDLEDLVTSWSIAVR